MKRQQYEKARLGGVCRRLSIVHPTPGMAAAAAAMASSVNAHPPTAQRAPAADPAPSDGGADAAHRWGVERDQCSSMEREGRSETGRPASSPSSLFFTLANLRSTKSTQFLREVSPKVLEKC